MAQDHQESDEARATARAVLAHPALSGLAAGEKIPTERALSLELGLSRHALRQALELLAGQGLITRQVGRGTFLSTPGAGGPAAAVVPTPARAPRRARRATPGKRSAQLTDVGPADVMAVRHILEPNAMPFVVARATSNDFQWMRDCLAGGDAAESYDDFEYWDLALHRAIIESSRNPLLIRLYQAIEDARHSPIWGDLKRHNSTDTRRGEYRCDHHAIVDSLVARDSNRASEAMQEHLIRIDAHLFGAIG